MACEKVSWMPLFTCDQKWVMSWVLSGPNIKFTSTYFGQQVPLRRHGLQYSRIARRLSRAQMRKSKSKCWMCRAAGRRAAVTW